MKWRQKRHLPWLASWWTRPSSASIQTIPTLRASAAQTYGDNNNDDQFMISPCCVYSTLKAPSRRDGSERCGVAGTKWRRYNTVAKHQQQQNSGLSAEPILCRFWLICAQLLLLWCANKAADSGGGGRHKLKRHKQHKLWTQLIDVDTKDFWSPRYLNS